MKKTFDDIALLIPAYNEAKYIEKVIYDAFLYDLDLIIVDDGSTDKTVDIIKGIKPRDDTKLHLIEHTVNKGKGIALKTGFEYAKNNGYTKVITLDADGQHKMSEIKAFLKEYEEKKPSIIVGSRFGDTRDMPFVRKVTNIFTSWMISKIAGKRIEDVQSGFRFIDLKVLETVKLETSNFDTEPELLLKASWEGYKITNVPITTIYHEDFVSHVNPFIDTIKFFKLVFRGLALKRRYLNRSHTTG